MSVISTAIRKSAGHHAAHCMLNIADVCGDSTDAKTAGNMLCHIRIVGEVGGGQKPDDFCAAFGCGPCHACLDSNGSAHRLSDLEWHFYSLRGMARTIRWLHQHGFITIKGAA